MTDQVYAQPITDSICLRAVRPEDQSFLQEVYAGTREQELALTNWNEDQRRAFVEMQFAAQQNHYKAYYPTSEYHVIVSNDQMVGYLYVARKDDEIRILDVAILPQHRGQGIGTPVLKSLMAEAAHSGKPLRVYVETYNRSIGLFQRLGFAKVEDNGVNSLMEWISRA